MIDKRIKTEKVHTYAEVKEGDKVFVHIDGRRCTNSLESYEYENIEGVIIIEGSYVFIEFVDDDIGMKLDGNRPLLNKDDKYYWQCSDCLDAPIPSNIYEILSMYKIIEEKNNNIKIPF